MISPDRHNADVTRVQIRYSNNPSKNPFDLVAEFHERFWLCTVLASPRPMFLPWEQPQIKLRLKLTEEEIEETIKCMQDNDRLHTADNLADILYIACGNLLSLGFAWPNMWADAATFWGNPLTRNGLEFLESDKIFFEPMATNLRACGMKAAKAAADNDRAGYYTATLELISAVTSTAVVLGIPLNDVFYVVHISNMRKLGLDGKPIYREDGKVIKPDTWSEEVVNEDIAYILTTDRQSEGARRFSWS